MIGFDAVKRKRLKDLGIRIGKFKRGRYNSITDVRGVRVGHFTVIEGEGRLVQGRGPVRTGVTAIIPRNNIYFERLVGGAFILNGAGEVSGVTQLMEWGIGETPICLTNTLCVGKVSESVVKWMIDRFPGLGAIHDVIIPVVGECDDSYLNDTSGMHVESEHVYEALENAVEGAIEEGSVGGGTGMVTCDFKAGIGTSSRRVTIGDSPFTIGVLVMSNFGRMENLRLDGIPAGKILIEKYDQYIRPRETYGSIIVVVGTDAPLLPAQMSRLCKRAALGIGRVGSYADHGSGEIIIGFSTANIIPRFSRKMVHSIRMIQDK
ncbi:MAG: P1 family peptidase, partial [Deltaproteobacteria bacterium]|nr:P1 family peptidase [Deltaproteobacteria bacterium]